MKKEMFLVLLGMLSAGICQAQEEYMISGKVRGMTIAGVHAVAADFGRPDTIASAKVQGENFLMKGALPDGVRAVNLVFDGVEGQVPLLLENANYQVVVTSQGAMIDGEGPAARLLKEFERVGHDYAVEKNRAEAEFKALEGRRNEAQVQALQVRLDNAYKQSVTRTRELIRANAGSYVAAYVIALGMAADDVTSLREKYDLLAPEARATVPGKAIAAALERHAALAEGGEAPNFTLTKPDGNTFSLHDLPAKWKLVHFWSSQVNSSRCDNAKLVRLYLQYRPRGLEIVSVSFDTNHAAWKQAIGLDGMTWTNGSDLKGMNSEVALLYLVGDLPSYILLDAENRVVLRDLPLAEIEKRLAGLAKKKKKAEK